MYFFIHSVTSKIEGKRKPSKGLTAYTLHTYNAHNQTTNSEQQPNNESTNNKSKGDGPYSARPNQLHARIQSPLRHVRSS